MAKKKTKQKREYEPSLADEAVDDIINDIANRDGLKEIWNTLKPEVRRKIRLKWKCFINERMEWIRTFG